MRALYDSIGRKGALLMHDNQVDPDQVDLSRKIFFIN